MTIEDLKKKFRDYVKEQDKIMRRFDDAMNKGDIKTADKCRTEHKELMKKATGDYNAVYEDPRQ